MESKARHCQPVVDRRTTQVDLKFGEINEQQRRPLLDADLEPLFQLFLFQVTDFGGEDNILYK